MADEIFRALPPSSSLLSVFSAKKHEQFSKTENANDICVISSFWRELESSLDVLERKYQSNNNRQVQKLLESKPIIVRSMKKLHDKLLRKMHKTPNMCNPWRAEIEMDMPLEIFDIIDGEIINKVGFGHSRSETNAIITNTITDIRKARYVFDRMNIEDRLIPKIDLLKKTYEEDERCEVTIIDGKPMTWRYYKNREVLFINFSYGYWNKQNIAQH